MRRIEDWKDAQPVWLDVVVRSDPMDPALTSIVQCRCGAPLAPGLHEFDRRGAEVAGWHETHSLVDSLTAEERLKPGYYPEGWTVRDLMAHLSAWLAEGGKQLERIHAGTYHSGELDVEVANRRFSELTEGIPFEVAPGMGCRAGWPSHRGELRF